MRTWTTEQFTAEWKSGELRGDIRVFFNGETIVEATLAEIAARDRWFHDEDDSAMESNRAMQFTTTGLLAHAWSLGMDDMTLAGVYQKTRWS